MNDAECGMEQRKPPSSEKCQTDPCPGIWRTGSWSKVWQSFDLLSLNQGTPSADFIFNLLYKEVDSDIKRTTAYTYW